MDLEELLVGSESGLIPDSLQGTVLDTLTVIGRICRRRESGRSVSMTVVECAICKEDPELFGEGLFKIHRGHLLAGIKPCGCGTRTRWSEDQYKLLCERAATASNLEFLGWASEYNKNYTRVRLVCPIHGELRDKSVSHLINLRGSCQKCWYDIAPLLKPKPDAEMIEGFFASESFPEDTIFYRSDRKSSKGKKVYWYVECPDCGKLGESVSSDLKAGKRPCHCSIRMPKYSYLLLLTEAGVPVCLKLGVTSNFKRRFKDLSNHSKYDVELIGLWEYLTPAECRKAELECLRNIECGVLTKEVLSNGYTETTALHNLDGIIKIFEENGGIRLTVH